MKKVLLATTALIATAGMAAAEIKLSGLARFGIMYNEGVATAPVVAAPGTISAAQAASTPFLNAFTLSSLQPPVAGPINAFQYTQLQIARNNAASALIAAQNAVTADIAETGAPTTQSIQLLGDATTNLAHLDAVLAGTAGTAAVAGTPANALTTLESRFRLNIDASTETDGGIKFGARVRAESNDDGRTSTVVRLNAPRFTVSAGGLTLGVGNINGALDSAPVYVGGQFGLAGLGWANVLTDFGSDGYSSTGVGRNGVELVYSMGDFGAHVSASNTDGIDRTELSLSYKVSGFTFAAGYQDSNLTTDTRWVLTANGSIGDFAIHAGFGAEHDGSTTAAIAGRYKVGAATTIGAFVAYDEDFNGMFGREEMAYALEVEHTLGGGATIVGGYSTNHGSAQADLGVTFNF